MPVPAQRLPDRAPLWRFAGAGLFGPLLALAWGAAAFAAEAATAEPAAAAESPEEFSRLRGLFDVDLPKTVGKRRIKFLVHPHFADLIREDYLRVATGMRLGLADQLEVNAELNSYLTHGLKGSAGYGLYNLHVGAKYEWRRWLKPTVDASTGFDTSFPLGRPPVQLTDGHNHFAPYVVFSRLWPGQPRLAPFINLGLDFLWRTPVPGRFTRNQPRSDAFTVAPGFIYDAGRFKYTLTVTYRTTAFVGRGEKHFLVVNPSVLWDLPPALKLRSTGRWILGVGFTGESGPEGNHFDTGTRLRVEFSFSRWLGLKPPGPPGPAAR